MLIHFGILGCQKPIWQKLQRFSFGYYLKKSFGTLGCHKHSWKNAKVFIYLDTPCQSPFGFSHAWPSQHVSAWCSPPWRCSTGTSQQCLERAWCELPGTAPSEPRLPTPSIHWLRQPWCHSDLWALQGPPKCPGAAISMTAAWPPLPLRSLPCSPSDLFWKKLAKCWKIRGHIPKALF